MRRLLFKILRYIAEKEQQIWYQKLREKYKLPTDFRFNGKDIFFYGEGFLKIGNGSYVGGLSTIELHKDCKVVIGNGCSISHNVRMYTSSKIPDYDFSDIKKVPDKIGDIIIGNHVWIGANVFINPGVSIGDNSVIGANSVVTKDIEAFGIYGGVPAKLIRYKKNAPIFKERWGHD